MERGRITKPKETEEAPSEYYLAGDLWVGACIVFNSHCFVLIDSDEYALRYMEANPSQVHPHSLPWPWYIPPSYHSSHMLTRMQYWQKWLSRQKTSPH